MSNRITAFAAAAFVACLAGTVMTTTSGNAAPADDPPAKDECLSAPKASTPAGGHWYYRIERGTKRKCWYLGDAGGKVNRAVLSKTFSAKEPKTPRGSDQLLADARAELPAGNAPMETTRSEQASLAETVWPAIPGPTADAGMRDSSGGNTTALSAQGTVQGSAQGSTQDAAQASAQGWNIASRWPASNSVASAETQPQIDTRGEASPALTADRLTTVAAATPPQAATTPQQISPPQAAAQPEDSLITPIRMLLLLITVVLVLAAILGRVIFKYLGSRQNPRNHVRSPRRAIWDAVPDDMSAYVQDDLIQRDLIQDDLPARRIAAPRNYPIASDRVDEIEELLHRASKRSAG